MFAFPAGWVTHHGEDLVTAYPPMGGRFRAYPRVRALSDFAAIVERILASDPGFVVSAIGETRRLVTAEGEHAAWVRVDGTRADRPARHAIGAVLTEDFAFVLDALLTVPSRWDELERRSLELQHAHPLRLGLRPRLYRYAPPPGWQALPSGLVASWYPVDFPRVRATIVVPPALPTSRSPAEAIEETLGTAPLGVSVERTGRAPVTCAGGVEGVVLSLIGTTLGTSRRCLREMAAFCVPPFRYTMQLEAADADMTPARAAFRAMVASLEPVPRPTAGSPDSTPGPRRPRCSTTTGPDAATELVRGSAGPPAPSAPRRAAAPARPPPPRSVTRTSTPPHRARPRAGLPRWSPRAA